MGYFLVHSEKKLWENLKEPKWILNYTVNAIRSKHILISLPLKEKVKYSLFVYAGLWSKNDFMQVK